MTSPDRKIFRIIIYYSGYNDRKQKRRKEELIMILAFYLEGCPYCRQARKAFDELTSQDQGKYSGINIDWVEERQHPEISDQYDYYHVPCMFVDGEKIYEAKPGEPYNDCKVNVQRVLDQELSHKKSK